MRERDARTIKVELPASGLEALEAYRQRMLALIGVELSEGQVAAMLIHFGKQVDVGRVEGASMPALLAPGIPVSPVPEESIPSTDRDRRSPAPKRREKAIATRASKPIAGKCACGCGGRVKAPGARWLQGHHKRGAKAATQGDGAPEMKSVWDGRAPLSRPWNRNPE